MTTDPAPKLFGQQLGETVAATRIVLDNVLAEAGTDFPRWVTLNSLATATPLPDDDPTLAAAAEALAGEGFVTRGPSGLALTAAGETRYGELRSLVAATSDRIYAGMPQDDLETARRVLAEVADRARALAG